MSVVIDRRFLCVAAFLIFLVGGGTPASVQAGPLAKLEMSGGNPVTDPLAVATFSPPRGWVRWDFWGIAAFSPTSLHTPRLTFSVADGDFSTADLVGNAIRELGRALSTDNYTLVQRENLYLAGWYGVRILAQGTDKNVLFGRDYIWRQDYFTANRRVSLVFRCDPASFETYRDAVLTSFRSLAIRERRQDGQ